MRQEFSDVVGVQVMLRTAHPAPPTTHRASPTHWGLLARFSKLQGACYWDTLYDVFRQWYGSTEIMRHIGRRTLTKITVHYDGLARKKGTRRTKQELTLTSIGPWEIVLENALHRVSPEEDFEDSSLVTNYGAREEGAAKITAVFVWLSSQSAREVEGNAPF